MRCASCRSLVCMGMPFWAVADWVSRYPEVLADKSFDNTGRAYGCRCLNLLQKRANWSQVLLEAPFDPLRRQMNSVLLTVDLTTAVANEAIERNDSIVIAYRASCQSDNNGPPNLTIAKHRPNNIQRVEEPNLERHTTAKSSTISSRRDQCKSIYFRRVFEMLTTLPGIQSAHGNRLRPRRTRRLARRYRNRHTYRTQR